MTEVLQYVWAEIERGDREINNLRESRRGGGLENTVDPKINSNEKVQMNLLCMVKNEL